MKAFVLLTYIGHETKKLDDLHPSSDRREGLPVTEWLHVCSVHGSGVHCCNRLLKHRLWRNEWSNLACNTLHIFFNVVAVIIVVGIITAARVSSRHNVEVNVTVLKRVSVLLDDIGMSADAWKDEWMRRVE